MGLINFEGKLPVAVTFEWRSDVVSDAVSNLLSDVQDTDPELAFVKRKVQNVSHVIANDLVTEFTINVGGSSPFVISRKATNGNKLFDDSFPAFITNPASGRLLDELIDNRATTDCTVDLTFTYLSFFDTLLEQITRTDADLHNIANPNDSKAILDTFTPVVSGNDISIRYKPKTETIKNIPAKLRDRDVKPRTGKPPAVKLVFTLSFLPTDATKKEAMRKLIALDWSKLARHGKPVPKDKTLSTVVATWVNNVHFYLLNHVDTARAERIRAGILSRHVAKSPDVLATDLREDIDLHLVTANHWGEEREDAKREAHQRRLSDLFGTLHQKVWLSSPVSRLRGLDDFFTDTRAPLTRDQYAALALQFGTGHCGEHSDVSFSILTAIANDRSGQVRSVIKTGNANIDHAFCVFNLDVDDEVQTITTNAANSRNDKDGPLGKGKKIHVWNLRKAIEKTKPRDGFVMDPYLDRTVKKNKAEDLLNAITDPKRVGKQTEFLFFEDIEPLPSVFGTTDLTSNPEEVRKRLVKNV